MSDEQQEVRQRKSGNGRILTYERKMKEKDCNCVLCESKQRLEEPEQKTNPFRSLEVKLVLSHCG